MLLNYRNHPVSSIFLEQKMVAGTIDPIDGYEFCCGLAPDTFFFPHRWSVPC